MNAPLHPPKSIQDLARWRDELRLQAHFFSAELGDQWKLLEKDWQLLESETKKIIPAAKQAVTATSRATEPLLRKLGDSLQRIQEGVDRHRGR